MTREKSLGVFRLFSVFMLQLGESVDVEYTDTQAGCTVAEPGILLLYSDGFLALRQNYHKNCVLALIIKEQVCSASRPQSRQR